MNDRIQEPAGTVTKPAEGLTIAHIVPGSGGGFYCENCVRDMTLVRALREQGHNIVLVPLYLPPAEDISQAYDPAPLFFGGINVYLQQSAALFRRTPRWIDRLFDAPWLLALTAKQAGSTRARTLEQTTLSMIRGEAGRQAKESRRLITWLKHEIRPHVVHLSNALLLGLARGIRQELDAAVVCSLQDEDSWVDAMAEPFARQCWDAMSERAAAVAAFVAPSEYYAGIMSKRLKLEANRIHVTPLGLDTTGYEQAPLSFDPPVLGYLSRLTPSCGFDRLVEVFFRLKTLPGLEQLQLHAMGGTTGDDRTFLARVRRDCRRHGVEDDVHISPGFETPERLAFLRGLSVLCVPKPKPEAFGLFALEAIASGVPVVEPDFGAVAELVRRTQGGILVAPHDTNALVAALKELLLDPDRARAIGTRARSIAHDQFHARRQSDAMGELYRNVQSRTAKPEHAP